MQNPIQLNWIRVWRPPVGQSRSQDRQKTKGPLLAEKTSHFANRFGWTTDCYPRAPAMSATSNQRSSISPCPEPARSIQQIPGSSARPPPSRQTATRVSRERWNYSSTDRRSQFTLNNGLSLIHNRDLPPAPARRPPQGRRRVGAPATARRQSVPGRSPSGFAVDTPSPPWLKQKRARRG
jgi:hypothetical protein